LIELWFYFPLDTKYIILETFPTPTSWLGMEKQPNVTKAHIHQSKDMYYNTK